MRNIVSNWFLILILASIGILEVSQWIFYHYRLFCCHHFYRLHRIHEMRTNTIDVSLLFLLVLQTRFRPIAPQSVCQSPTRLRCANTATQIEVLLRVETLGDPRIIEYSVVVPISPTDSPNYFDHLFSLSAFTGRVVIEVSLQPAGFVI